MSKMTETRLARSTKEEMSSRSERKQQQGTQPDNPELQQRDQGGSNQRGTGTKQRPQKLKRNTNSCCKDREGDKPDLERDLSAERREGDDSSNAKPKIYKIRNPCPQKRLELTKTGELNH